EFLRVEAAVAKVFQNRFLQHKLRLAEIVIARDADENALGSRFDVVHPSLSSQPAESRSRSDNCPVPHPPRRSGRARGSGTKCITGHRDTREWRWSSGEARGSRTIRVSSSSE